MTKRIFNGTPHNIVVFAKDNVEYIPEIRKYVLKNQNAIPIATIPSNGMLNAAVDFVETGTIDDIPIFNIVAKNVDPIPDADIVIVSNMYATYAKQFNIAGLERLYTIGNPVYQNRENPRPIGCLGLVKVLS